jgi:hypothetical protein
MRSKKGKASPVTNGQLDEIASLQRKLGNIQVFLKPKTRVEAKVLIRRLKSLLHRNDLS